MYDWPVTTYDMDRLMDELSGQSVNMGGAGPAKEDHCEECGADVELELVEGEQLQCPECGHVEAADGGWE